MILLQRVTLLELLDQRSLMSDIKQSLADLEGTVDTLSTSLATARADIGTLKNVAVESSGTLKALADAVLALRSDAVPADIAIAILRVQDKAKEALGVSRDIDAKIAEATVLLADAEDKADDVIEPAPVVVAEEPAPVVVEPVVQADAPVATESDIPASVEQAPAMNEPAPPEAVPAEGGGDVIVVDGEVPVADAPLLADQQTPAPQV